MTHALPYANTSPSPIALPVAALVWLTISLTSIVVIEPAPCDFLLALLIIVLPLTGSFRLNNGLLFYGFLWTVILLTSLLSTSLSFNFSRSATHVFITSYLAAVSLVIAAFVCKDPVRNVRLIYSAYIVAALFGAVTGIVGYFDLFPGARSLFVESERAAGLFKDPNVLGAFLVPAYIMATSAAMSGRLSRLPVSGTIWLILSFALILAFSRGAIINAFIGLACLVFLLYVTSNNKLEQLKLFAFVIFGVVLVLLTLLLAINLDSVSELLTQRASLQRYDTAHGGRFDRWITAIDVIFNHPLGIGSLQFKGQFGSQQIHNVYLAMFLNAGWLGGFSYLVLTISTMLFGFAHAFKRLPSRQLFIVAYSSFVAMVVEGFVIDTDHWRHYFIILAVIWGLMSPTILSERRR